MQIALPELNVPATLMLDPEQGLSDEQFLAFCEANPDLWLEKTAKGEIVIVPPAGGESDYRTVEAVGQLQHWAKRNGRGKAFGPSAAFILPDTSTVCPDCAWVSNERLASLTKKERQKFLRLTPEFVIEVLSPTDRLKSAQKKMSAWMLNGVELGWLIDGDARCVYVYRNGRDTKVLSGIDELAGEGPVEGFVLELSEIWQGL
jgi:Uma2 family endonuclease